MAIEIREVAPDEIPAVVEIALAAWEPYFAWMRDTMGDEMYACFNPDWRAEKAREVRETCAGRDTGIALLAETDGRVAGFVTYYEHAHAGWAEIGNNAVHPHFQGRGIGPAMYQEVFRRLQEHGIKFVKVCTGADAFHARARRAYEKCGFNVTLPGVEYFRALQ